MGREAKLGLVLPMLLCATHAGRFHDCPRVDVRTEAELWDLLSEKPFPVMVSSSAVGVGASASSSPAALLPEDFVAEFSNASPNDDGVFLEGFGEIDNEFLLTGFGSAPDFFARTLAQARFQLPPAVASIDLRPIFSIGRAGPAEVDIAHHYHGVTAMLLLQGEKWWALRAPTDEECNAAEDEECNAGACGGPNCTDPMDVCAVFRRGDPAAPPPPCVQRKGEVVIVPDGWYHGTCNNAPWTVGWGGQGRRLPMVAPPTLPAAAWRADHPIQITKAGVLARADVAALERVLLAGLPDRVWHPVGDALGAGARFAVFLQLGRAAQAPLMALRSLLTQFVAHGAHEAEAVPTLEPVCAVLSPPRGGGFDPFPAFLQHPVGTASVLLPLNCDATLVFTDDAGQDGHGTIGGGGSGGRAERVLAAGRAAVWRGHASLRSVTVAAAAVGGAPGHVLFCLCKVEELGDIAGLVRLMGGGIDAGRERVDERDNEQESMDDLDRRDGDDEDGEEEDDREL